MRGIRKVYPRHAPAPRRIRRALEYFVIVVDVAGGKDLVADRKFFAELAEAYVMAARALGRAVAP